MTIRATAWPILRKTLGTVSDHITIHGSCIAGGEHCLVHTSGGYVAQQLYDESWAFDGSMVLAGDVGQEHEGRIGGHSPPYLVDLGRGYHTGDCVSMTRG